MCWGLRFGGTARGQLEGLAVKKDGKSRMI
jgi:hypothetical protein